MSLEDLKKEHRSVSAPRTVLGEAMGQFENHKTRSRALGLPVLAWSFVTVVILGVALYPVLMESPVPEVQPVMLNLAGLATPIGPTMPSLSRLSAPSSSGLTVPQLNQITLASTRLPVTYPMEKI